MIINYSISFKALDRYVFQFNSDQQAIGTKLRQSMIATAKEVIKIYGASLLRMSKVTTLDPCNLPSLRTNNIQLAKITQASGRTIQRHIVRLIEAGVLTHKVWRGSNASYELFISPKILWINGVGSVDKVKNDGQKDENVAAENQVNIEINSSKCPHSYAYKKAYKRNNRIIAVDKLENSWGVNYDEGSGLAKKEAEKTRRKNLSEENVAGSDVWCEETNLDEKAKKEAKKTRRKNLSKEDARRKDAWRGEIDLDKKAALGMQTGAQKIEVESSKGGVDNHLCDASRHAFLSKYVDELWGLAKDKLYQDVWLNKRQCDIAIALLYRWYEPVSSEKMDHVHRVYKSRVGLAAKYIAKDPSKRFVTLPCLYFDPNNKKGFTGTKSWYEAEKAHKTTLKFRRIVQGQIRKFKKNEAKDTAEGRPRLTVYRECEQHIRKLKIPALLDQFYAAVSNFKVSIS